MKQVKFFVTLAIVAGVFLISCNSGGEKKASDATVDSSTVKKDTAPAPAPIHSGPVLIMTITHKVADYAKWKPGYDSHDSVRLAHGLHNYVIARGVDDSNMVMVALKMEDVDKAKEMAGSKEMMEKMKKSGVTGPPAIAYSETVMNDTIAIQQTVRLMVRHKVKDWDTWKKAFDDHKQKRIDAGLTDRVVAHAVGDDHSVTLVFAVADLDKAKAFIKSTDLKDIMNKAGVVGPPTFFFYRIAEKY
jgi:hypothetical protein